MLRFTNSLRSIFSWNWPVAPLEWWLSTGTSQLLLSWLTVMNLSNSSFSHVRIIKGIHDVISRKSQNLRVRASYYILVILETWSSDLIGRSLDLIEECLLKQVADASPDCRKYARASCLKLQEIYPEEAEELFEKMEPSVQKMLQGEGARKTPVADKMRRTAYPAKTRKKSYLSPHAEDRRAQNRKSQKRPATSNHLLKPGARGNGRTLSKGKSAHQVPSTSSSRKHLTKNRSPGPSHKSPARFSLKN